MDARDDRIVYEAKWKKSKRLVTRRETPMGSEMIVTYELSADGAQLLVTVEVQGGRQMPGMKFRRVYDRTAEPAADEEVPSG